MKIESMQNEHLKYLMKLKEKKYRDQEGLFLIEGDHLIKEALNYGLVQEIVSLKKIDVPVKNIVVNEQIMKKLSFQVSIPSQMAVVKKLEEKPLEGTILFLDGIQDPGNLGTIIRSAIAFQVKQIVLSKDSVDLYNDKVLRSTQGMLFQVNILRRETSPFLSNLKEAGYKIYGSDVRNGEDVSNINFDPKTCIVIGSEGKGMKEETRKLVDKNIYIKMASTCESLNAGVAASIILYERSKHL